MSDMMVATFAAMFFAVAVGWLGRRRLAVACVLICLGLFVGLFLFEIYSPEYGFRMPWIQTDLEDGVSTAQVRVG
jgi:hypothetical protein